jgi:hypothetical protein
MLVCEAQGNEVDEEIEIPEHERGRAALDNLRQTRLQRVVRELKAHVGEPVKLQAVLVSLGIVRSGKSTATGGSGHAGGNEWGERWLPCARIEPSAAFEGV